MVGGNSMALIFTIPEGQGIIILADCIPMIMIDGYHRQHAIGELQKVLNLTIDWNIRPLRLCFSVIQIWNYMKVMKNRKLLNTSFSIVLNCTEFLTKPRSFCWICKNNHGSYLDLFCYNNVVDIRRYLESVKFIRVANKFNFRTQCKFGFFDWNIKLFLTP